MRYLSLENQQGTDTIEAHKQESLNLPTSIHDC